MSRFSRQALRDNRSKKKRGSSSRAFLAFAFLFLGLSLFFLFERYSAVHHYAEDSPLRKVLENAKTDRGSSLITDPLRSLEDKKKKLPESDAGVIAKTDVIEKKSQDDTDNSPQEKKADDDTIEDSETEKSDAANLQHLQHSPDFAGWENNGDHGAEIALPADQQGRTVYFVNISQVSKKDSFSASWLQSKNDFLGMDLSIVQICEDAAFKAWSQRLHKLRMTLDYLDFSVEHLSKWWKMLDWHQYPIVYDSITSKLARYITYEDEFPTPDDPVLKTTVATIAFQPYSIPSNFAKKKGYDFETWQERAHNLTVLSMAATIESLRRAEMGRVVIAGSLDMHEKYAQDSFRYLVDNLKNQKHETKGDKVTKVGHMEVGFTVMDAAQTKTKHLERNMPKGVLVGAREAFVAADLSPSKRTVNQTKNLKEWFGDDQDPNYWQYLYLTEPDSILQTRTASLKQLKAEVDSGGILSPFRLQPIPHESDLRGLEARSLYLNEADGFEEVIELDQYNNHDVCCDEHKGPDFRPGMEGKDEECGKGTKWFMCGFVPEGKKRENPHKRLKLYKLIRLAKGTGLTTIAGNLFARRCQPAKNSVCTPPSYVKR